MLAIKLGFYLKLVFFCSFQETLPAQNKHRKQLEILSFLLIGYHAMAASMHDMPSFRSISAMLLNEKFYELIGKQEKSPFLFFYLA